MANLTEKMYRSTFTFASTDYCNIYELLDENMADYITDGAKHILLLDPDVDMLEFDTSTLNAEDRHYLIQQFDGDESKIPEKMYKSKMTVISNMTGTAANDCVAETIDEGHIDNDARWLFIDEYEEDQEISLDDLKKQDPGFVEVWYELYPQDEFGE